MSCKTLYYLLVVALFAWGCEPEELVAPSALQSDSEALLASDYHAHNLKGPVHFTIPLTTTDPGDIQVVDGIIIVKDQINEGPISGDLEGHAIVLFNAQIDEVTGLGTGEGTLVFFITAVKGKPLSGTWRGRFKGVVEQPLFTGSLTSKGSGALAGTKLLARFSEPDADNVFQLSGKILKHHGHMLSP